MPSAHPLDGVLILVTFNGIEGIHIDLTLSINLTSSLRDLHIPEAYREVRHIRWKQTLSLTRAQLVVFVKCEFIHA